jgi:hypothetical protein
MEGRNHEMSQGRSRYWPIAVPYPHFMGFAPLDIWMRLLLCPRADVPPRFWVRLGFALALSFVVSVISLPERLLTAAWLRLRKRRRPLPGPVIILGYYRSGTTLLQYLLSRDPNLYSPDWTQAFAPHGFCLTWVLLRWFLLPFLPRTRPQDNVDFGPLVPAEDDFALNAWALASTLPGRLVLPALHAHYDRFHDLGQLTPAERERWRYYQYAFVRKLAPLAGNRRVLLKTPAHTARIESLLDLFRDTSGVKFVYITRHPHQVFRSNVSLLQRLTGLCGLGPPLEQEELEEYLCREFLATEEQYRRSRSLIAPGNLAEIRLQDLQADPLGTVRRIYEKLGMPYSEKFERGMLEYLHAHQDFKPNVHPAWTLAQKENILPRLDPLIEEGGHEKPAIERVELPPLPAPSRIGRFVGAAAAGLAIAVVAGGAWLWLLTLAGEDSLGFVWPIGVGIGVAVLRGAGHRGSVRLGIFGVALTTLTIFATLWTAYELVPQAVTRMPLYLLLGWFWWALALASAYRIGSQRSQK